MKKSLAVLFIISIILSFSACRGYETHGSIETYSKITVTEDNEETKNKNKEIPVLEQILFNGLEITFGANIEFIENKGLRDIIKIPTRVKVLEDKYHYSSEKITCFGPDGKEVENANFLFENNSKYKELLSGIEIDDDFYLYYVYNGDGNYYFEFVSGWFTDNIQVRIPIKK